MGFPKIIPHFFGIHRRRFFLKHLHLCFLALIQFLMISVDRLCQRVRSLHFRKLNLPCHAAAPVMRQAVCLTIGEPVAVFHEPCAVYLGKNASVRRPDQNQIILAVCFFLHSIRTLALLFTVCIRTQTVLLYIRSGFTAAECRAA